MIYSRAPIYRINDVPRRKLLQIKHFLLLISLAVAFKEIGPRSSASMGLTSHTLGYYAEINAIGKKLRPRYYVHCDLKRCGKLSSAASYLRDIKDSCAAVLSILYDEYILGEGKIMRSLLH